MHAASFLRPTQTIKPVTALPPVELPEPPEYPSPTIVDSRRLMGPNVYSAHEGAVLEVNVAATGGSAATLSQLLSAWADQLRARYAACAWPDPDVVVRQRDTTAFAFASAPVDALMKATSVSEQAWVAAEARAAGDVSNEQSRALRALAQAEVATRPMLAMVHAAAIARGVTVTFDDDTLSLGSGTGSHTWPLGHAPHPDDVVWRDVHDVPVALVTGSNGKTTTTRLVAAMWRAAGRVAGWCCSDGVWVDDMQLEAGDYSGPAGARQVLRDARVQAAVLETARGGILRRGLAVHHATAAIITNIAADHFGEYGVHTLRDLADTKGVVARAVGAHGTLVLNADDPHLVSLGERVNVPLAWFSVTPAHRAVDAHVARGGAAAMVRGGHLWLHSANQRYDLGAVADMPLTLNGVAPYNVANIAGASVLAAVMGVPIAAIRSTVLQFGAARSDNPGRLQLSRFGSTTVFVDYAHNPDGLAALCRAAASMPAKRRLLVLGQAGNRDDAQLRALVRAAWDVTTFDHVIIKELPTMLRGRPLGQIPGIFADELRRLGVLDAHVEVAPGELDAVTRAMAWAQEGDVLVCPVHVEKGAVLEWLARLGAVRWQPGTHLPE